MQNIQINPIDLRRQSGMCNLQLHDVHNRSYSKKADGILNSKQVMARIL